MDFEERRCQQVVHTIVVQDQTDYSPHSVERPEKPSDVTEVVEDVVHGPADKESVGVKGEDDAARKSIDWVLRICRRGDRAIDKRENVFIVLQE